jgi:hypothetical protein
MSKALHKKHIPTRHVADKPIDIENSEKILYFVQEYITSNRRFCSVQEIANQVKIGRWACDKCIDQLIEDGKLSVVFEIPRRVKLVAPKGIVDMLTIQEPIQPWLKSYQLPEKRKIDEQRQLLESQLRDFEQFELLLTANDKQLVEAVAYSLRWLGFTVEVKESEGHQDIEYNSDEYSAIMEVKGLEKWARIDELRQVVDYHMRKLKETDKEFDTILLINHFRNIEPNKRDLPFSKEVLKAVKQHYSFVKLVSTYRLYQLIGEVIAGVMTKKQAQDKLRNGMIAEMIA